MTVQLVELAVILAMVLLLCDRHERELEALHVLHDQHARERADQIRLLADLATHAGSSDPHPDLTQLISLVDRLCQRVQAPDVAVTEHAMTMPVGPMPQPRPDQGYEGLDVFPEVSKEELAERYASVE